MFLTIALDFEIVINPLFPDPFTSNRLVTSCCCNRVPSYSKNRGSFGRRIEFLDSHWSFIRNSVLICVSKSVSVLVS